MDIQSLEIFFQLLANRNRIRILKLLKSSRRCVCELSYVLGITQPSVSKHLRMMKKAGLIGSEQDGFWTNYYLLDEGKKAAKYLEQWIKNDPQVKADLNKAKTANRKKLYGKP